MPLISSKQASATLQESTFCHPKIIRRFSGEFESFLQRSCETVKDFAKVLRQRNLNRISGATQLWMTGTRRKLPKKAKITEKPTENKSYSRQRDCRQYLENILVSNTMASTIKSMVSKKKCRYKEDKFDLDLTYIAPRIIAMGFPAEKFESIYRNDYNTVKEFLDKKHAGHYWVYNLCSERERIYDKSKFDGRVSCYAFDDHHPPKFSLIQPFCDEVKDYLDKDERNVAVVHCKAGKGRTGVMICCYLLYIEHSENAERVLTYYAKKRTTDQKGVTIPSQRRYITYYDAMNRQGLQYKPVKLYLKYILLDPVPSFSNGQTYISFEVTQKGRRKAYNSEQISCRKQERTVTFTVNPPLLLQEDVKFEFSSSSKPKFGEIFVNNLKKPEKQFHFWLNTFFVDMVLDSSLAHDLTGAKPIIPPSSSNSIDDGHHQPYGGDGHVHHASGSSEDSSADDVPLRPPHLASNGCHPGGGHHVAFHRDSRDNVSAFQQTSVPGAVQTAGAEGQPEGLGLRGDPTANLEVTNLIKNTSISDDHLLQDRRSRQSDFSGNSNAQISSMGPLSTSDENTSGVGSSSSGSGSSGTGNCDEHAPGITLRSNPSGGSEPSSTTAKSFIQQRLRHTSMPQPRVSSTSGLTSVSGHIPHHHLEASLSHSEAHSRPSLGHTMSGNNFFSRHHATITSSSAASLDNASSSAKIKVPPIPGKMLSLRLTKYQIDKAHKDKVCKNFPDNFSVTLILVKPDDQSDDLMDYSLYPAQIYANYQTDHGANTITAAMSTNSGSNDKFTIESVAPGPASNRRRPLTGGSGNSSSSATPSLKSVEQQSSQDSVASSDGEVEVDFRRNNSSKNSCLRQPHQPPASTAI